MRQFGASTEPGFIPYTRSPTYVYDGAPSADARGRAPPAIGGAAPSALSPYFDAFAGLQRAAIRAIRVAAAACLSLGLATAPAGGFDGDAVAAGPGTGSIAPKSGAAQRLYRFGRMADGRPLRGTRDGVGPVEGADAACANCHRRSGFGSAEGAIAIPPLIGHYLFRPYAELVEDLDVPHFPNYRSTRPPYDDRSLGRAIREGLTPDGRALQALMPRYDLDDATLRALVEYLHALGSDATPGVTPDALHFATVVTPEVPQAERRAMVEVIERFFADHNRLAPLDTRPALADRGSQYRVQRTWRLHVWELSGPPDTWEAQLQARIVREPVLAAIAGIGKDTWAPIHRFCETQALPCLLPIVDLPVDAEADFYTVYFSRGVLLESALIGRRLTQTGGSAPPRRVLQVARSTGIGRAAANALDAQLADSGTATTTRWMPGEGSAEPALGGVLSDVVPGDALVLWLTGDDLARLPVEPPSGVEVYISGLMAGREQAPLPPSWRAIVRMAYPLELPGRRNVAMNYPYGWMKGRRIAPTAEWVQVHAYLVCQILSDTLVEMLDGYSRDYLVERVESMLSHRLANAYYPRLSLAAGQRFASKGGYLVRFSGERGERIEPDGGWTVP